MAQAKTQYLISFSSQAAGALSRKSRTSTSHSGGSLTGGLGIGGSDNWDGRAENQMCCLWYWWCETRSIEGHQSMIINTRNGPRRVKHVLMRCNRVQSSSWAWILSGIGPQDIWRWHSEKQSIDYISTDWIWVLVEIGASVQINSDSFL